LESASESSGISGIVVAAGSKLGGLLHRPENNVLSFLAQIAYRLILQELSPNSQCTANPLSYHNMQQLRTLSGSRPLFSRPPPLRSRRRRRHLRAARLSTFLPEHARPRPGVQRRWNRMQIFSPGRLQPGSLTASIDAAARRIISRRQSRRRFKGIVCPAAGQKGRGGEAPRARAPLLLYLFAHRVSRSLNYSHSYLPRTRIPGDLLAIPCHPVPVAEKQTTIYPFRSKARSTSPNWLKQNR